VAFFAMLAAFPALAALIRLTGVPADPSVARDTLAPMAGFVPAAAHARRAGRTRGGLRDTARAPVSRGC
jgi:uncharacterized BrkB/YihY/UPF0761 family membrane protein